MSPRDQFGYAVGIDGDTAVVEAIFGDATTASDSGSAYVFERDGGGPNNWGQAAKLTASDAAADDRFGWSTELSGDTILVGALRVDDLGTDSGSAYVSDLASTSPAWASSLPWTAGR